MDIVKIGLDSTEVTQGTNKAVNALDRLIDTFAKLDGQLAKHSAKAESALAKVNAAYDKAARPNAFLEGQSAALEALHHRNVKEVRLVSSQNSSLQALYESRLAIAGRMTNEELRIWKDHGVSLGKIQTAQLKGLEVSQLALKIDAQVKSLEAASARHSEAVRKFHLSTNLLKDSSPLSSIRVATEADSKIILAEMTKFYAQQQTLLGNIASTKALASPLSSIRVATEADSTAILTGMQKFYAQQQTILGNIASTKALASPLSSIRVATEADSTAILAGMQKFYAQQQTILGNIASTKALASPLSSIRVATEADSKIILAEMTKFYAAAQNVASTFAKAGKLALDNSPLSSIRVATEADSKIILGEMTKFYAQQQTILGNIAATKALESPLSSVRKQTELDSKAVLSSMREYYLGLGAKSKYESTSTESTTALTKSSRDLSEGFKRLASDGNDVHSMARGLASGFGALWLTWGNLAPLFIGAALSNGFVQTAKTGMDVAHTFAIIEHVGGNTRKEIVELNTEMLRLAATGPHGPMEIAEAMKTLSLAGLKANEILSVTKDVLNFSVAGTTDLKTAAESLMAISTAFGLGAAGFGKVSDVVSKAAAESMTSVESFSNAMKTASVISAQYGVSLEDTATAIAALSQLGIQGTAAGTALRNMYADLSGRSGQVAKVLRQQGIELRDVTTGGFKPLITVVGELNEKFNALDAISQKNLMQALLSERGAKGIVELLRMIQTEAKDMGAGLANALEESQKNISDSAGFAAITAAKMAQTAENQFKQVKASLSAAMTEAYAEMEPALLLIADAMQKTFASPEFKDSLKSLVSFVAEFGRALTDNIQLLGTAAVAYAGLKVAQMAIVSVLGLLTTGKRLYTALITSEVVALEANTAATNRNTLAKTASAAATSKAVGIMGVLARGIPFVGTALTLATTAWVAYDYWMGKSNDTAGQAKKLSEDNIIKSLEDQTKKLNEVNALRAEGLSLQQAELKLAATAKNSDLYAKAAKLKAEADEEFNKSTLPPEARARVLGARYQEIAKLTTEAENYSAAVKKAAADFAQASKWRDQIADSENKAKLAARQNFGKATFELGSSTENTTGNLREYDQTLQSILKREAEQAAALAETGVEMTEVEKVSATLAKELAGLAHVTEQLEKNYSKMTPAQVEQAKVNIAAAEAAIRENAATETQIATKRELKKWLDSSNKLQASAVQEVEKNIDTIKKQIVTEREATDSIGLTKEAIAELTSAKYEDSAASKERLANIMAEAGEPELLIQKYRQEAAELRDLADARRQRGVRESAHEAFTEWQRAAEKIQDTITDALMRGFESGKGFAQVLKDTVVNMFKTLVLRPVIQGIVGGMMGMGASGASASGLEGLIGGAAKSGVGSLIGGITFGGSSLAAIGSSIGTGFMTTIGGGSVAAASGAYTAAGMTGVAGGLSAGAMAAAAVPYVGAALLALNAMGAFRSNKVVGGGLSGTLGEGDISAYDLNRRGGSLFSGPSYSVQNVRVSDQSKEIQDAFVLMRSATAEMATQLGLANDSIVNFTTRLGNDLIHPDTGGYGIKLDGLNPEEAAAKIQEALATANEEMARKLIGTFETTTEKYMRDVELFFDSESGMAVMGREEATREVTQWVAGEFVREGETAAQTLQRLAGSLTAVNTILATMDQTLMATSLAGGDAASKLVDLFGSLETFTEATGAYYQAFYTEAERNAKTTEQLTTALSGLGLTMPESLQSFRQLVEAQDLNTEAGRKAYAALIQLSPAFAQVTNAVDQARAALAQERYGLETQLLQAQGDTLALRAREREAISESNRDLFDKIKALEDQKVAQEAADRAREEAQRAAEQAAEESRRAAEEATRAEQARVEAIRNSTRTLIDEINRLRGIGAVESGQSALQAQFAILTAQARAGDTEAIAKLPTISRALEDATRLYATSASDVAYIRAVLANSLSDTVTTLGGTVPAFANGGMHSGGIRLVGENGPELEVTGSARYYSASQTQSMLNSEIVAEIRALREEVSLLRAEARATAVNTGRTQDLFKRVTRNGESVVVSTDGEPLEVTS